jgi:hypothetical protein
MKPLSQQGAALPQQRRCWRIRESTRLTNQQLGPGQRQAASSTHLQLCTAQAAQAKQPTPCWISCLTDCQHEINVLLPQHRNTQPSHAAPWQQGTPAKQRGSMQQQTFGTAAELQQHKTPMPVARLISHKHCSRGLLPRPALATAATPAVHCLLLAQVHLQHTTTQQLKQKQLVLQHQQRQDGC